MHQVGWRREPRGRKGPASSRLRTTRIKLLGKPNSRHSARLSALETKSVTRKTQEVYATSVREFCGWSALLADSNVEASEVDRLLTEFMNLLSSEGHRAWKGEKLLASVLSFFPTCSQLERNGSELPSLQRMEKKASSEFFETTAPGGSLECSGYGCAGSAVRWRHVRSLSPTKGNAVTRTSSFLPPTEGGVRSWVIVLFP